MTIAKTTPCARRAVLRVAAAAALASAAGCSSLLPKAAPQPAFFTLDKPAPAARAAPLAPRNGAPTIALQPPQAAAGFDGRKIIYTRKPQQLEYFAHNEWVDSPARMLAPLMVQALADSGAFGAVVSVPGALAGDLRLDTQIVRLQHEFDAVPSRVRLTLRATLVDLGARRVLAVHEFDATEPAASDDPYGGVVAAQAVVQRVLQQLAQFSAGAVRGWQPGAPAR